MPARGGCRFPGEWDPGWWALMVLRKLGLVWAIRLPAALPKRAELLACDDAGAVELKRQRERMPQSGARLGMRHILRLCWKGAIRGDARVTMEGPAATLPASLVRRIVGPRVEFQENAAAARMVLHVDQRRVRGLPALCVSLSLRNPALRLFALCVAPLAVAFESTREAFDVA